MNVSQVIPKEQKAIIVKALQMLDKALSGFDKECNVVEYERFDIKSLLAFLDYDVSVTLSKERMKKFCFIHGVDFPEYTDVKAQYPIEVNPVDEWVTLMVGDFSPIDDENHVREIHINNLVSMERHLRSQVADVIDNLDDGHGWFVVEDFEGVIVTDTKKEEPKDEREFQVIYLKSHYEPQTMSEDIHFFVDNGFSELDFESISDLSVNGLYTTEQGGVVVVRIC